MKRALVGSVVVHLVLGGALLSFDVRTEPGVHGDPPAIAVEIVAPPTIAPPSTPPPTDVQGGGSPVAQPSEAVTRRTDAPPVTARRVQATKLRVADLVDYQIDRASTSLAHPTDTSAGGIDRDGEGGEGNGIGNHRGDGIGFSDGNRIVVAEEQFALPPPPVERPVSKARPAKLIYPTRERDLGEDRLFVARVTVDRDGYVIGARLVRGRNGPRDDEAADLIFRFRYLPALDDAGHAVRSTFEQPFHVNR